MGFLTEPSFDTTLTRLFSVAINELAYNFAAMGTAREREGACPGKYIKTRIAVVTIARGRQNSVTHSMDP